MTPSLADLVYCTPFTLLLHLSFLWVILCASIPLYLLTRPLQIDAAPLCLLGQYLGVLHAYAYTYACESLPVKKGTNFYTWLLWKQLNTQCIQKFISMCTTIGKFNRCEIFVGGCHGNDCIRMLTKFHLHVYYTEQVIGVKK